MCSQKVLRSLDDRHLVAELRAGCAAALAEVDHRYRRPLHAHGARLLRDTAYDPEDLVQDTLLRAWSALPQHDGDVHLQPWLHAVLRNRALDLLRRASIRDVALTVDPPGDRGVLETVVTAEDLRETLYTVAALPPGQRRALLAHAVDGRPHVAIARDLGVTEKASKLLVHRARTRLRAQRRR